ncbi:hypothetical protein [Streptomyces sp. 7N604]|uniref:hypothetical protein n=1 Tax=Streptomyces sp. 7N604 TaxID=3457415 RepID=UPI003FD387D0
MTLVACTQDDIDTWLADGTVMRYDARGFVLWVARSSRALLDLAAQMPPAVLGQVLGVAIKTATEWAEAAGSARSEYAAELSRRPQDADHDR